jgi:hypothetical protein
MYKNVLKKKKKEKRIQTHNELFQFPFSLQALSSQNRKSSDILFPFPHFHAKGYFLALYH